MSYARRRQGFVPAADVDLERAGLPGRRARALRLTLAWERAAGSAVARRAAATCVRRGVLDVAVEQPRWAAALAPLLPRLASRLARLVPEFGIRRVRLVDASGPGPAVDVEPAEDEHTARRDHRDSGAAQRERGPVDVEGVARAYLQRREGRVRRRD